MKRYDVELHVMPWKWDRRVPRDEALATAVSQLWINGELMLFESDYSSEEIVQGGPTLHCNGMMMLQLDLLKDTSFEWLGLTADDVLEGSTRDCVLLPVASLAIVECEPADEPLLSFPTA